MKTKNPRSLPAPQSLVWIIVPILAIPILTFGASLESDGEAASIAGVLADLAILILPSLALLASFKAHVTLRAAAATVVAVMVSDVVHIRSYLYAALEGLLLPAGNPSWITVAYILACTAILVLCTIVRPTLSRLVFSIAALAQIATLSTFHHVAIMRPLAAAEDNMVEMYRSMLMTGKELGSLCGISDRFCFSGTPEQVRIESAEVTAPGAIHALIADTADRERLFHSWSELIEPSTHTERLRQTTMLKTSHDQILVMIEEIQPTRLFEEMKLAFGALATAFQTAWMFLCLLITWRHRPARWSWKSRKWMMEKSQ